jgi:hypothetical protein
LEQLDEFVSVSWLYPVTAYFDYHFTSPIRLILTANIVSRSDLHQEGSVARAVA